MLKIFTAALLSMITVCVWAGAGAQMLEDPVFAEYESGHFKKWGTQQHAGEKSYEFSSDKGVLSIRRMGVEPWGAVTQRVPVQELAGKTLRLQVEVRGYFKARELQGLDPSAVKMIVHGWPANPAMRFMGLTDLAHVGRDLDVDMPAGKWQTVELDVELPKDAVDVELYFVMAYDGELQVRSPRLYTVEAANPSQAQMSQ